MLLCADDPIAKDFEVLNLNTGKYIQRCIWADQETGEYKKCMKTPKYAYTYKTQKIKSNIVLVFKGE